ncbi:MAG: tRNA (adenine-N1)-methyltransferase [Calditrichaeota bacterium]|nr:MAG: tRNA (adenine-N1)-methyltransferase [Calditrichota bacterium]
MAEKSKLFAAGNPVIFLDKKERSFYAVLEVDKIQNIRGDFISHDEVIGKKEGAVLFSQRNKPVRVFRATLTEQVLYMPRGAQVVYPKDIGLIIAYTDIFPGAKVVEAGLGSGALTSGLLRAVGEKGMVVSYEIREDFINNATKNMNNFFGGLPENHMIKNLDIYENFEDADTDRLVLDLPEPWKALENITPHLRPGALVCCYIPTILQVKTCVDTMNYLRCFSQIQIIEALEREWKVDNISVRPSQRMVGHTAFLIFARRVEYGVKPIQPAKTARLQAGEPGNDSED